MNDNEMEQWARLPPAQRQAALSQVLRLGTLGEENELIKEQIAQAMGQQKKTSGPSYGPWGGLFTGLGDAMGQIAGVVNEKKHRAELAGKLAEQQAARDKYAQLALAPDPPAEPQAGYIQKFPDGKTRYTGGGY